MSLKLNSTTSVHQARSPMKKQQGSALVMAVFIIVVVLLLATALVNMLSSSSDSIAYQVVGTRAFAAANSGAEMRLKELFPLDSAPQRCDSNDLPGDTNNNQVYDTIRNTAGLNNCFIRVLCNDFEHDSVIYYKIQSTGTCSLDNSGKTSRTVVIEARSL